MIPYWSSRDGNAATLCQQRLLFCSCSCSCFCSCSCSFFVLILILVLVVVVVCGTDCIGSCCYWYFIRQQFPQLLVGLASRWKSSFEVGDHVGLITILETMAEAGSSYKHQFSFNFQRQTVSLGRLLFFFWNDMSSSLTEPFEHFYPILQSVFFSKNDVQGNGGLEKKQMLVQLLCFVHMYTFVFVLTIAVVPASAVYDLVVWRMILWNAVWPGGE